MWIVDQSPADPTSPWPPAVVDMVVTSFSQAGDRVVLVPPTPADPVLPDATVATTDPTVDAALDAVHRAGRGAALASPPTPTRRYDSSAPRPPLPYWADVFHTPHIATPTADSADPTDLALGGGEHHDRGTGHRAADLVIASIGPDTPPNDHFGLACAALLRTGGTLAVLTHSDWTRGRLVDPTGPIVAAAQNADLLYLQHIIAVHAAVRDGRFVIDPDNPISADEQRGRHRAAVRGLPVPHLRVHTDVLVFAQPHDHDPVPLSPAAAAFETGVIR